MVPNFWSARCHAIIRTSDDILPLWTKPSDKWNNTKIVDGTACENAACKMLMWQTSIQLILFRLVHAYLICIRFKMNLLPQHLLHLVLPNTAGTWMCMFEMKTNKTPAQWYNKLIIFHQHHYNDVIMGAISSQITSITVVYLTVYSGADQRKHQSSASLAFVGGIHRGPVNSPHKWPVMRKMFPFDDVIMS